MNFSYWEKTAFTEYDFIIIGSGITGLNAAIVLKEKQPKAKVLILERGLLPSGASTKNAGFACFGSLTEILDDLQSMSEEESLRLIEKRWKGLQMLRNLLGDKQIGFTPSGGYELIESDQENYLEKIDTINEMLKPIFKEHIFELQNDKIQNFGFNQDKVKHLIANKFEGGIHTGKMMYNLIQKAISLGINIVNGAEVKSWELDKEGVMVHCSEGKFHAQQLGIANNAFAKKLLPDLDIRPGRGLVLVTKELTNVPFDGVFHYDRGYYYFRNIDNRILLGGGRNLDYEGENTTEFGINPLIQKDLEEKLHEVIAPNLKPEIDYHWSGIMAFGPNKNTLLGRENQHVSYALRLGGMGVAIGTLLGRELAKKMLKLD